MTKNDILNENLVKYLNKEIVPKYDKLDLAHRVNHVKMVIESSLMIAKDYDVDLNMVYTVAVFHDLGLLIDRENHHINGGIMLEKDSFIRTFFNNNDIKIMKEAVEDHRASAFDKPRNIYGLIISEADLYDHSEMIIERSFLFRLSTGEKSFDKLYFEVRNHIEEKYGKNGYLNSWLNSKRVEEMLLELRNLLENEELFKSYCYNIFKKLV